MLAFVLVTVPCIASTDERVVPTDAAFAKGWDLYNAGQTTKAVKALNSLMKNRKASTKERFNATYTLAVIALEHGSVKQSLSLLKKADRLIPDRPQVALRRAQAQVAGNQFKAAKKSLNKADALIDAKKQPELFVKLQRVHAALDVKAGSRADAIVRLTATAKSAPKDWRVHFDLATLYEQEDEPSLAIAAYKKVIDLDPKAGSFKGVYAYHRHAALTISSDPNSYGNRALMSKAIDHYKTFIRRGAECGAQQSLIDNAKRTVEMFERFGR